MRKFLIVVVVLLLIVGGVAIFLVSTTPREGSGIRFPLGDRERALIAQVPASADAFAIVPTAAAFDAKLRANPITHAVVETWSANQPLPRSWMIGDADLVAWRNGKTTRYLLRLDPFRAVLVRMYLIAGGNIGGSLLINATTEQPLEAASISRVIDLASHLKAGDALVVQRENVRGAYPPIARPTVTSVQVTDSEIRLTSVGPASAGHDRLKPVLHLPTNAILSASFATPPRVVADLDRLFGGKVSALLEAGGTVCIYDVDLRKLLPRPRGVIVIPADPERRAIVESLRKAQAIGINVRTAERGNTLLVSFDDSIPLYQKDELQQSFEGGNAWSVRIDPVRLVPILNGLGENLGLRLAAPRLYRSARDLRQWISGLEQAKIIEASDSMDDQLESLHVRIAAK